MARRTAVILIVALLIVAVLAFVYYSGQTASAGVPAPQAPAPEPSSAPQASASPNMRAYIGTNCPAGWEDRGVTGMLINQADLAANPLSKGGEYGWGWWWNHGKICYGDANKGTPGLYKLSPTKTGSAPQSGVIWQKSNLATTPFPKGGGFNDAWDWTHPYLVPADGAGFSPDESGLGPIGILMNNGDLGKNKFPVGAAFNEGWMWIHPNIKQ